MKKVLLVAFMLTVLSFQGFAGLEQDIFDIYSPLHYNGKPVDKMMLGYSTYNRSGSGSGKDLFADHFLHFYTPMALADLRVDVMMPGGSNSQLLNLATVVPLGFASLRAEYFASLDDIGDGTLGFDMIFSNMLFNWGIGVNRSISSSSGKLYPSLKVAKGMDLWASKVEAKLTVSAVGSSNPEIDVIGKIRPNGLPIFGGLVLTNTGSNSYTTIMVGGLFTL